MQLVASRVNFYLQQLGISNAIASRITHSATMVAEVYRIEQQSYDPLILKICNLPRHYYRECKSLERLADVVPVPRITGTIPPNEHINGAILMEYIPGTMLNSQTMTANTAHELGTFLARVHSIRGDGSREDAVRCFIQGFEENIAECKDHIPAHILQACRRYVATHVDLLGTADGPCMAHRDFHPGNILVDNDIVTGIIDWSSAQSGFAEEDLCVFHSSWHVSDEIKNIFFRGYEKNRTLPDYHTTAPLLKLNKRLAIIGFTVRTGSWKTHGAEAYQHCCQQLEKILDTV